MGHEAVRRTQQPHQVLQHRNIGPPVEVRLFSNHEYRHRSISYWSHRLEKISRTRSSFEGIDLRARQNSSLLRRWQNARPTPEHIRARHDQRQRVAAPSAAALSTPPTRPTRPNTAETNTVLYRYPLLPLSLPRRPGAPPQNSRSRTLRFFWSRISPLIDTSLRISAVYDNPMTSH